MAAASTIPARMQVAHPTLIEISIPRSQLDIIRPNQSRSQPGSNPYNRDPSISRAVSVRLISEPPGALMIASLSPDTIWFDQPASSNDERMTWRFAVSPNTVGRFGLTLATTGRTLGPFGTQIDSNPPTETFEIKTWRPLAPRIGRVFGYVAVFTIGAVAAFLTSDTIKAGFVALSKLLDR